MTDFRSFTQEKTRAVHREIALAFQKISQELQIPDTVISRGDSTLRGHYPLETEVLRDTIEETLTEKSYARFLKRADVTQLEMFIM